MFLIFQWANSLKKGVQSLGTTHEKRFYLFAGLHGVALRPHPERARLISRALTNPLSTRGLALFAPPANNDAKMAAWRRSPSPTTIDPAPRRTQPGGGSRRGRGAGASRPPQIPLIIWTLEPALGCW